MNRHKLITFTMFEGHNTQTRLVDGKQTDSGRALKAP